MNKEELIQQLAIYNKQLEILNNVLTDLRRAHKNDLKLRIVDIGNLYSDMNNYKLEIINVDKAKLETLIQSQFKLTTIKYNETLDKLKSGS